MQIMMAGDNGGCTAFPEGDSLYQWSGKITGGASTAYEGLEYTLSISFPEDYPYKAPTIKFTTPCYRKLFWPKACRPNASSLFAV